MTIKENISPQTMITGTTQITFRLLAPHEPIPYHLLLLADPSKEMINSYLSLSKVFIAETEGQIQGVIVIYSNPNHEVEIKNIAVEESLHGKGIGTFLIKNAIQLCRQEGVKKMYIGTANSSIGQLYLYQKLGFNIEEIRNNYFINHHYPQPIFENGIQAKHLIMLSQKL